jgi:L-ribulose-5-phosphate 4-epimerase
MIKNLRLIDQVVKTNKELIREGLVIQTWGNASAIDKESRYVLIKPSGVPFENLKPEDISIIDLSGKLFTPSKPSVDTPTHLEIYKAFEEIGGIIHSHSHYATVFAQAKMDIPCFGTTHADHFRGDIPIISDLSEEEVKENYELNSGKRIVQCFKEKNINPLDIPAILLPNHGVFVWGETLEKALENAIILERVAKMAFETIMLARMNDRYPEITSDILKKHFSRKHGQDKYYGQEK